MGVIDTLEAPALGRVIEAYRDALRSHQDLINRLNVYPVPDGDTGTNMALTVESVVTELGAVEGVGDLLEGDFGPPAAASGGAPSAGPDMVAVCKAIAHGSLMGARGNSGVILSQLLRGCTRVLAAASRVGPAEVAQALGA